MLNYRVGSRIRFRLYAGREFDGVIRAILKTATGVLYRVGMATGRMSRRLILSR
jgi:hypothetical protein